MSFWFRTLSVLLFAISFQSQLMAQDSEADVETPTEEELAEKMSAAEKSHAEAAGEIFNEDLQDLGAENGFDFSDDALLMPEDRIIGISPAQFKALTDKYQRLLLKVGEQMEAAGGEERYDLALSEEAATLKIVAEMVRELANYTVQEMAVRRQLLSAIFLPGLSYGMEFAGGHLPKVGKVGAQGSVGAALFLAQGEDRVIRWKFLPYFLAGPNFNFKKRKEKAGMAEDYENFRDQNHYFMAGGALFQIPVVGLEINSVTDIAGWVPYVGMAWDVRIGSNFIGSLGVYGKFGQKSADWFSPKDEGFGEQAGRFAKATWGNIQSSVRPSAGLVYAFFAKGHQPRPVQWQPLEVLWFNTLFVSPQWADDGLFHDTEKYSPGELLRRDDLDQLTESEKAKILSQVAGARERVQIAEEQERVKHAQDQAAEAADGE